MTDRPTERGGRRLTASVTDLEVVRQRALLVGVIPKSANVEAAEASLEELALLVDTAGSEPVETDLQRRERLDPALVVGKGKAAELAGLVAALDIDVAVFDLPLSPTQQRNLQQALGVDVVDREAVILDIFAQHATSRAGMLQVELALLRYRLPRLRGRGVELSRLGGGIGTRGPGETKLETDRRRISDRIRSLEKELEHLGTIRATQRKARKRSTTPEIAFVGYTNAGKSTLLNLLTDADVLVEDRLFSTLDSTVRRFELPGGQQVLLADTVGFVQQLPHHLVEAFKSTLDEAVHADLLLHLVDGASGAAETQIGAVREVLGDIGAGEIPELLVLNKSDAADPDRFNRLRLLHPDGVAISARSGDGIPKLVAAITDKLAESTAEVDLFVPYARGDVVAALHRRGDVLSEDHGDTGTRVRVRLPRAIAAEYDDLAQHPQPPPEAVR
jgi:GTP-binding protein HflX